MALNIETIISGIALIGGLALVISMIVLEKRPRKGLTPRLIPTTPVMFAGIIVIMLALAHLLTVAGRP